MGDFSGSFAVRHDHQGSFLPVVGDFNRKRALQRVAFLKKYFELNERDGQIA
jgi:hypothetical protein